MTEKIADSIISAEVRAAAIRKESARIEAEQAELAAKQAEHAARQEVERRKVEDADIEQLGSLYGLESRDQLLDHIRKLREPQPELPRPEVVLTERMKRELEEEQAAGRAAVAAAEQRLELRRKAEALAKEREHGDMGGEADGKS